MKQKFISLQFNTHLLLNRTLQEHAACREEEERDIIVHIANVLQSKSYILYYLFSNKNMYEQNTRHFCILLTTKVLCQIKMRQVFIHGGVIF